MIPIFVCGFIVKLAHDGILSSLLQDYALIFLLVAASQLLYVFLIFLITNKLNTKKAVINIKNLLPAALTGFGTMSSAAAMPLTLLAAEKMQRMQVLPNLAFRPP
jgi:Na+/H+-dicarboxylate symporter